MPFFKGRTVKFLGGNDNQKSGINSPVEVGRLVVHPVICSGFYTSQVVGNGISEPSTVLQGSLPSLKVAENGWLRILFSFWGPAYFEVRTVSFREGKLS